MAVEIQRILKHVLNDKNQFKAFTKREQYRTFNERKKSTSLTVYVVGLIIIVVACRVVDGRTLSGCRLTRRRQRANLEQGFVTLGSWLIDSVLLSPPCPPVAEPYLDEKNRSINLLPETPSQAPPESELPWVQTFVRVVPACKCRDIESRRKLFPAAKFARRRKLFCSSSASSSTGIQAQNPRLMLTEEFLNFEITCRVMIGKANCLIFMSSVSTRACIN